MTLGNPSNVQTMVHTLPHIYALARYYMLVIESLRSTGAASAFDENELVKFLSELVHYYNEIREESDFISIEELAETIREYEQFENRQCLRMAQAPK